MSESGAPALHHILRGSKFCRRARRALRLLRGEFTPEFATHPVPGQLPTGRLPTTRGDFGVIPARRPD